MIINGKDRKNSVAIFFVFIALMFSDQLLGKSLPNLFDGKFSIDYKQTRMMQFENLRRVDIGNPEIVSVSMQPGSSHFILLGLSPGKTDVTLWGTGDRIKRYEIRVKGDERHAERETLLFLLGKIDGVFLGEIEADDRYTIGGEPVTIGDYEKVMELVSRYDNVITNIERPVFDAAESVRMRIKYLEISSQAIRKIGIDWDNLLSGVQIGVIRRFTSSPFGDSGNSTTQANYSLNISVTSAIRNLVQDGHARVLKEQSILVESGLSGSMFAGGEFPVTTRGQDNTLSTEYKPFGMSLQIEPLINQRRQIHTSIDFEMSALDRSVGIGDNPILRTSRQSTTVTLENQTGVIIADFVSADDAKTVRKVPGLGHVPVFGELFKSREFQREKTELYVLIEPEIIESASTQQASEFFSSKSESALKLTKFKLLD